MKKCPFCAEEIQDDAIKCKHCGEILNKSQSSYMSASDAARAVTKGLKKKEIDDMNYSVAIFFCILAGIGIGLISKSIIVGLITLLILGVISAKKWYKE